MGIPAVPDRSFSRDRRLLRRADFLRVQASPLRVAAPHVVILLAARLPDDGAGDAPAARLGVVASKKLGCAPVRARAKRLLRELFRAGGDLFPPGIDYVMLARGGLERLKLAELRGEVERLQHHLRRRAAEARGAARGSNRQPGEGLSR